MKKASLFFLFILFFSGAVFGNEKISFSIVPEVGIINGKINEFVYYLPDIEESNTHSNEIRKLSELNWDVYWEPYLGANLKVDIDTGMYFDVGLKFGVPRLSYAMVDRDWTNCINYPDKNWLTNYSIHQNYLESYYEIDFAMGQKFSFLNGFLITPELYISNNSFSFMAEKGWGLYGENWRKAKYGGLVGPSESGERITWKSKVITYKQNRMFFGAGLGLEKKFDFGLSLGAFCKTRFVYIEAEDHHINTRTKYLDQPYGFGGILAGGSVGYKFNKRHQISLKGFYDWLPSVIGIDSSAYETTDNWSADPNYLGGASSDLYSFSLSYTFSF